MALQKHGRFIAAGVSAMLLGMTTLLYWGCNQPASTKPVVSSTSVSGMLMNLPNLKSLAIDTCSYTVRRSSVSRGVPSPSDIRMELRGTADISDSAGETLTTSFDWKIARRDDIPPSLSAMLPPGDVMISAKFNETFINNPTYTHGLVAIIAKNWTRVYFLATDRDHPIK